MREIARVKLCSAAALFGAAILIHVCFLLSLKFGFLDRLFNDTMHRYGPGCDFFAIYQAGWDARHGRSLYEPLASYPPDEMAVPYFYPFRYLPLTAYLWGIPLSLLSQWKAYFVWVVLCEALLLLNLYLSYWLCPDRRRFLPVAALWLSFSPYYLELFGWFGD